ncbi:MAG: hypothetical protein QNI84_03115 [Henriciella sp.]|nr:hypothetical protein [Henriciella sp.]
MADGSALADIPEAEAKPVKAKAAPRAARKMRKFKVDFWATDFNLAEIGIMKRTQNEAASDQFTKDMEIFGQTVINKERKALLAYRQELWDASEDFERRLVVKLFSERLHWRGTAELLLGRSMQLTLGAGGLAVPSFSINLGRHEQLIQLERSAHQLPFFPESYSFFLQTKSGPKFYRLKRNVMCFGTDFSVLDQQGRKIGKLDGRVVNLGGAWMVKLDPAYANAKLEAVLQLFCAVLKFKGSARRHIRRLGKQVRLGKLRPQIDHHEDDLYLNPRRRR